MPLNIEPQAPIDGVLYASSTVLTSTEAVLGNLDTPDPIPVIEGQEVVAVVKIAINGFVVGHSTYVVMQTDLGGDGTWIDVAWCVFSDTQGTGVFVLCGGGRGAMNNAFRQSRQANSAPSPQANGSNACPIGGRVRFVGKTLLQGGSSIAAGSPGIVTTTITYKLQTPR